MVRDLPPENTLERWYWQLQGCPSESAQRDLLEQVRESDPRLADTLEDMLAAADKASGFMVLESLPRAASGSSLAVPKQIGPYKILEPIGQGGMGIVYLAQQSNPVRRKVALKIIKPGMDSRQVIARFEAERQALAMMEHPNIAKVLDAGTTEAGLPFFAMELVRGIPITDYCDRARMPTRQRLELFCDACGAIQHAHNKGVIHRDIKPSNVLVTEHDGTPVVKVIDFGIAKALTDNLTEKTLFSGLFQMIGTPLYMSPEQASLSNLDVDVRSDVYSLGVMLYELVSGALPIDRESAKELSFEQLRQRICDSEPLRPSRCVSTLKDDRAKVAERRGVDSRQLSRLISSELDWIVMKAIEKDRRRRYQSARDLGEDVRRHLDNETVEACPPSLVYKLKKTLRRNRVWVVVASLVFCAVLAAIVGTTSQAVRATRAERESQGRLEALQSEQVKTKSALATVKEERRRSEQNYEQARQAVDQMLTRVGSEQLAAIPEMAQIREELLADAVAFYTKLLELNPNDAQVYASRGQVFDALDEFEKARSDLQKAVEYAPNNADFHHDLARFFSHCGDMRFRDVEQAIVHANRACRLQPKSAAFRGTLGTLYYWTVRDNAEAARQFEMAAELSDEAEMRMECLMLAARASGDHERVVSLGEEVDPDWQVAHQILHRVAETHFERGEYEKVIETDTRALESARRHFADTSNKFAFYLLRMRGRAHFQLGAYQQALEDVDAALNLAPYRSFLHKDRGRALFHLGDYEESIASLRRAFELNSHDLAVLTWVPAASWATIPVESSRREYFEFINHVVDQTDHTSAYRARANFLMQLGEVTEARSDLAILVDRNPRVYDLYTHALAALKAHDLNSYSSTCKTMVVDRPPTRTPEASFTAWTSAIAPNAIEEYTAAINMARRTVAQEPTNERYLITLGAILMRAGHFNEADEQFRSVDELPEIEATWAVYLNYLHAMNASHLGHAEEARATLSRADELGDAELATAPIWERRVTITLLRDEAQALIRRNQRSRSDP